MPIAPANEQLRDAAVRHAVGGQRLSAGAAKRLLKHLEAVDEDLDRLLRRRLASIAEKGLDTGPVTTKRLQKLRAAMAARLRRARDAFGAGLLDEMLDMAREEPRFQERMILDAVPTEVGGKLGIAQPSQAVLRAVVTKRPFAGGLLKDHVKTWGDNAVRRAWSAVQLGLSEAETIDQISRRVREATDATRRGAELVTRTAANAVMNGARQELYAANADLVKRVQWVSTLDGRTTPVCISRDGKTWPADEGPRPPAHLRCRSTICPVLKSWKEMGFDVDEAPPATRASLNGQVPATETYGTWLRKQPRGFVEDVLGKKKAKLFLDGELPVDKFVDRTGAELTLKQLEARHAGAWRAAGLSTTTTAPVPTLSRSEWVASLSQLERESLELYSGPWSTAARNVFQAPNAMTNTQWSRAPVIAAKVEAALDRASLDRELTVWRGVDPGRMPVGMEVALSTPGSVVEGIGFTSTSLERGVAEPFGEVLLRMRLPKGARAVELGDLSEQQWEREVLIQRGAKMRVTATKVERGHLVVDVDVETPEAPVTRIQRVIDDPVFEADWEDVQEVVRRYGGGK